MRPLLKAEIRLKIFIAINKELEAYNPELAKRPQVIAANKMDAMPEEDREVIIEMLEEAFRRQRYEDFPDFRSKRTGCKRTSYGMLMTC